LTQAIRTTIPAGIDAKMRGKSHAGQSGGIFHRGQWAVYLDPEDVPRAIRDVEDNLTKDEAAKT
jgi:hypothetical protein